MKKYMKIICALWFTALTLFALIELYRINDIDNALFSIILLLNKFLDIIVLKEKNYILFVLFYFLIFLSIICSILSYRNKKKNYYLVFLYFIFCLYITSFYRGNIITPPPLIKKELLQSISAYFYILSFAFYINYFGMINFSFIEDIFLKKDIFHDKTNIDNENVEKVDCKVDNIDTKEKRAETLRGIELSTLFLTPRNDERMSYLSLAKEDVDMGNGEPNIKPVFIIGPDGEKIYPGRTFLDRIIAADQDLVQQYSDLKNLFLSYRKVHTRVSKTNDAFRFEGKLIGKIIVAGKGLKVYLALDPFSVDSAIYHQRDASGKKKFVETPLVVKVKSPLSFRKASKLIAMACENVTVKKTRYTPKDWTKVDTVNDEDNND